MSNLDPSQLRSMTMLVYRSINSAPLFFAACLAVKMRRSSLPKYRTLVQSSSDSELDLYRLHQASVRQDPDRSERARRAKDLTSRSFARSSTTEEESREDHRWPSRTERTAIETAVDDLPDDPRRDQKMRRRGDDADGRNVNERTGIETDGETMAVEMMAGETTEIDPTDASARDHQAIVAVTEHYTVHCRLYNFAELPRVICAFSSRVLLRRSAC